MARFQEKVKLLKGLLTGKVGHVGPSYVSVDVTRRCNLRCLCCRFHSPLLTKPSSDDQTVKDIPFSLYEKLCDELKTMGTNLIILEGEGEPLLHSRIFELISIAKQKLLQVMLFTNGVLLDESRIHLLIDSRLDILKVSLWASSAEEYEKNYPGASSGNFKKIVEALKLLACRKAGKKSKFPSVELCHPINRCNFQNIKAMIDLAMQQDAIVYFFLLLISKGENLQNMRYLQKKKALYIFT